VSDTFPRQYARTQRLTLGEPRNFTVSPDGARVLFVRSHGGSDSVNTLWVIDTATGVERELLDPRTLATDLSALTPEELRRRERAREGAAGIVSYATDASVTAVVTVLGGQVVHINVATGEVSTPSIEPGVFDVRLSPDGNTISYVRGASLCIATLSGDETVLASETTAHVTWGSAEFIAAEEMGRMRGYWWSPDSQFIAACRADSSNIPVWYIADPANPSHEPIANRYPAAGAENAVVSLHVIALAAQQRVDVSLSGTWEYLNSVSWNSAGLIAQTQTRDQKRIDIHRVDPTTGSTIIEFTDADAAWVELVPGVPSLANATTLVTCADRDGVRRVLVNGTPVTPTHLQVRSVVSAGANVIFMANHIDTPWVIDAYSVTHDGSVTQLTDAHGVVSFSGSATCNVVRTSTLDLARAQFTLTCNGKSFDIANLAETPLVSPNVRIMAVGPRSIPVAIVMPSDGLNTQLPVLFDPYGGPHAQRVVASRAAYNSSQWFADQGFVVVIADGVGTPGKGSDYERDVMNDLAQVVLDDQVEIARALPDLEPRADITRVGIRGWSFGGYLAALAVLRRGDIFHAGVAGAPVTDWRLYDTHYTERYLGHPATNPAAYEATDLMNDAHKLEVPLLIIHGLADDNVVAAHTLQLSSALLAAGKVHEVLPLSGVTHMTPQEEVAENLLLHQLDFLKRSLN
jgi:dipeptidyl-peptidase-4